MMSEKDVVEVAEDRQDINRPLRCFVPEFLESRLDDTLIAHQSAQAVPVSVDQLIKLTNKYGQLDHTIQAGRRVAADRIDAYAYAVLMYICIRFSRSVLYMICVRFSRSAGQGLELSAILP